jgi:hypothetical protein
MKGFSACLIAALSLGACGVGDEGNPLPPPTDERLCTVAYTLSGNYTVGQAPPDRVNNETQEPTPDGIPDIEGCWPVGTWTFSMTPTDGDCSPEPSEPASVTVKVDFVDDPIDPTYNITLQSPTSVNRVKISQGGGGLCEGVFELFSDDGKETYNLHPTLNVYNQNGPLEGQGEFARFTVNQIPISN